MSQHLMTKLQKADNIQQQKHFTLHLPVKKQDRGEYFLLNFNLLIKCLQTENIYKRLAIKQ